MAIAGVNLLYPDGPVQMVLYPKKTRNQVVTILNANVQSAYNDARVDAQTDTVQKDALARALALSMTFEQIWIRMNAEPMTVDVDGKGSHGYEKEQIASMKAMADKFLGDFNGLLDVYPSVHNQFPGSISLPNRVIF